MKELKLNQTIKKISDFNFNLFSFYLSSHEKIFARFSGTIIGNHFQEAYGEETFEATCVVFVAVHVEILSIKFH